MFLERNPVGRGVFLEEIRVEVFRHAQCVLNTATNRTRAFLKIRVEMVSPFVKRIFERII